MKPRRIRAVVLDLDGTLLDTAPDFVVVVNELLREQRRAPLPAERITASVSNGASGLIRLAFGIDPLDESFEPLRQRLLALYGQHLAVATRPYPGIPELLSELAERGLPWGIATNKPEAYTRPLLEAVVLTPPPACVICPEHVSQRKPHPGSLYLAAEQIGCDSTELVYVGDHQRDIDCGRAAGALTIAAAYGYIEPDDDPHRWQADLRVDSAEQLWPLIEGHL